MPAILALIAALTPAALQMFQAWAQRNANAGADEVKGYLEQLAAVDRRAAEAYAEVHGAVEDAKRRLAAESTGTPLPRPADALGAVGFAPPLPTTD